MDKKSLAYKGTNPRYTCCDQELRILSENEWVIIFMTGGHTEPDLANHVCITRSERQGEKWSWSEPEIVIQKQDKACTMSEVILHEGKLTIHLQIHNGDFSDWKNYTIESTDGGRTWTEPVLFEPFPQRGMVRNLYISTWGDWYLPTEEFPVINDNPLTSPMTDGAFNKTFNSVLISKDEGKTWTQGGIVKPGNEWAENNIVELSDGRLVMLIRFAGSGVLYRSESLDRGLTWTEAKPSDIPNSNSKARIFRLSDGRFAIIHNPDPDGGRNPISLWVSDDDMKSWSYKRDLTDFPGYLAYPGGVVDEKEEYIHFAIDYNRHDLIYWGAKLPAPGEKTEG